MKKIFIALILLLLFSSINGQNINFNVYANGIEFRDGEIPLAFIYGDDMRGWRDAGYNIITMTGDTLYIKIKENKNKCQVIKGTTK